MLALLRSNSPRNLRLMLISISTITPVVAWLIALLGSS